MKLLTTLLLLVTLTAATAETLVLSTMDIRRSPTTAPLMHRTNSVTTTPKVIKFTFYTGDLFKYNPNSHGYLMTDAPKVIKFTFYTGDLFKYNPNSHGYLMTDGYIDSSTPRESLQGRGLTIGHTRHCNGVGFEKFGVNSGFSDQCKRVKFKDNSFYDFTVYTDNDIVDYVMLGPDGLKWYKP